MVVDEKVVLPDAYGRLQLSLSLVASAVTNARPALAHTDSALAPIDNRSVCGMTAQADAPANSACGQHEAPVGAGAQYSRAISYRWVGVGEPALCYDKATQGTQWYSVVLGT